MGPLCLHLIIVGTPRDTSSPKYRPSVVCWRRSLGLPKLNARSSVRVCVRIDAPKGKVMLGMRYGGIDQKDFDGLDTHGIRVWIDGHDGYHVS